MFDIIFAEFLTVLHELHTLYDFPVGDPIKVPSMPSSPAAAQDDDSGVHQTTLLHEDGVDGTVRMEQDEVTTTPAAVEQIAQPQPQAAGTASGIQTPEYVWPDFMNTCEDYVLGAKIHPRTFIQASMWHTRMHSEATSLVSLGVHGPDAHKDPLAACPVCAHLPQGQPMRYQVSRA